MRACRCGKTGGVLRAATNASDWIVLRRLAKGLPGWAQRTVKATGSAASFGALWAVTAAGLACTGARGRRAAVGGLAAYGTAVTLANGPIKWMSNRRRPRGILTLGLQKTGRTPTTSSFPSAHTAGAAAFAIAAGAQQPIAAPVLALAATCVGLARVQRARHFPTDVMAGALLGTGVGAATAVVMHRASGGDRSQAGEQPADGRPIGAA
jgi:undecaprenyl-diphosphatase